MTSSQAFSRSSPDPLFLYHPETKGGPAVTIIRFSKKADFLAALEARRPWAIQYDKKLTTKHKAEEKAALDSYRAKLRHNLKLSYAELDALQWTDRDIDWRSPSCPRLAVPKLDHLIAALGASSQQTYNITDDRHSTWGEAFWLLTHDENALVTPC